MVKIISLGGKRIKTPTSKNRPSEQLKRMTKIKILHASEIFAR
jgi:hypothetical protein